MTTQELVDVGWILVSAALVMFMQAGFAALESGMVRSKNSINVAAKNFADFLVIAVVFWLFGFGVMFGETTADWFGTSQFLFNGGGDPWLLAFFVFQLGFVGTAATIVSGAVAERMRFASCLLVTLVVGAVIYPVVGHWAWGSISGLHVASDQLVEWPSRGHETRAPTSAR